MGEVTVMEGDEVELEVTRVGFGFNSLPVIEGKLVRRGERKEYDSGISSPRRRGSKDYDSGISSPDLGAREKRVREEEKGEEESSAKKIKIDGLIENPVVQKKSKKKKKRDSSVADVEDGIKSDADENNHGEHKKSKKKKSLEKSDLNTTPNSVDKSLAIPGKKPVELVSVVKIEEGTSINKIKMEEGLVDNSEEKKSSKKKKKKRDTMDLDDKALTDSNIDEENQNEHKKSKKKKASRESLENSELNQSSNTDNVKLPTEMGEKREDLKEVLKKRKKKSKDKSIGD